MLKFYFSGAPNPTKVGLFLEEAGLPYEAIPIDARRGEQHRPEYLAINPNAKVPAVVDGDVTVFDSNAILLYLAEKTGKFLPPKATRPEASYCHGLCLLLRASGRIPANWCTSRSMRRTKLSTPSTGTPSKRSVTSAFSMRGLRSRNTCSAIRTPSLTWTCGVGRV